MNTSHRQLTTILAALPLTWVTATNQEKPNILCIVCEDISPILGCYGDSVAVTPHLDTFSKEAIRYNMFTSVGVSAPSRYSLITGRYPSADGANYMRTIGKEARPENIRPYSSMPEAGVRCFTEYLREAGYYCTNNNKTDHQFTTPPTAWDECGVKAHWKNAPDNVPFFSIFNLNVTHESQVWVRTNKALSVSPNDVPIPPYYPDNEIVRHDIAVAYSNVTAMDKQFSVLVEELRESGKLDNTIIIYYSDNGGPLPRQKRAIYESGMLVPFMIRFPDGYRKGEHSNELVAFVDIPATILSLANVKPNKTIHGTPFLGKYKEKERQYVYGARDRMDAEVDKQGCVRDAQYRYVRNYRERTVGYMPIKYRLQMPMMRNMLMLLEKGELNNTQAHWFTAKREKEEFYHTANDPHEINNLIHDPKYAKEIARLRKAYNKWDKKYNKYWHLSELENLNRIQPQGSEPQVEKPEISILKNGKIVAKCATKGANIAYKKDMQQKSWTLYTEPFTVECPEKITFIATRIGYAQSEVSTIK